MIGGAWWLFRKQRDKAPDPMPIQECAGFYESLTGFLSREYPGLRLFRERDSDTIEVWYPTDPRRAKAEEAVDAAWERSCPR